MNIPPSVALERLLARISRPAGPSSRIVNLQPLGYGRDGEKQILPKQPGIQQRQPYQPSWSEKLMYQFDYCRLDYKKKLLPTCSMFLGECSLAMKSHESSSTNDFLIGNGTFCHCQFNAPIEGSDPLHLHVFRKKLIVTIFSDALYNYV